MYLLRKTGDNDGLLGESLLSELVLPKEVKKILHTLIDADFEAYAVGGCVRDLICHRQPTDWDVTTSAKPEDVKRLFKRTFDTGIRHGTVSVLEGTQCFEVTTYRIDGVYEDHRHPREVTYTSSIWDDLKRRDFTINAMALDINGNLLDPHNGLSDIKAKIIRAVGDPDARFGEDALRMMRAVRFAAQLGYEIDKATSKAIVNQASSLKNVSMERICAELVKLITSPHPRYLQTLSELGLTAQFFPEFDTAMQTPQNNPHHRYSVGGHILASMEHIRADKHLRLTMMFHDIAKPLTKTINPKTGYDRFHGHPQKSAEMAREIMCRLKLDNDTIKTVSKLVLHHDYDIDRQCDIDLATFTIDERYVRRAISVIGREFYPLFLEVKTADILAQSDYFRQEKLAYVEASKRGYEKIMAQGDCVCQADLAINGHDLLTLGVPAGAEIGRILKKLLDDVINYPAHNEREYLLAKAKGMEIAGRSPQ